MAAGSLLMAAAMMFPLLIPAARHAAFRSRWARRHRAIGGVLIGYLGVWTLATFAAALALGGAGGAQSDPHHRLAALGLMAAAAWQLTPAKRAALRTCHRSVPLAPDGWRADASCLRYGVSLGGNCVLSCWALMLCPMLAGQSLVLMAGGGAMAFAERLHLEPPLRLSASVLAAAAALWMLTHLMN
jgi:predicted metal-binding membrane protein